MKVSKFKLVNPLFSENQKSSSSSQIKVWLSVFIPWVVMELSIRPGGTVARAYERKANARTGAIMKNSLMKSKTNMIIDISRKV